VTEAVNMYEQLQGLLDVLSQTPGAIIYRDVDGWKALQPGSVGQVLTLNSELLPEWQTPT
jgi:hypothetical protein